jgi:hypothetical protein
LPSPAGVVPSPSGVVPEPRVPERSTVPAAPIDLDRESLAVARSQGLSAWVSAIATVVALAISVFALLNQVRLNEQQTGLNQQQARLNEQQTRLNAYAQARDERKYSSRIAVWAVAGEGLSSVRPSGLDVSLQNRAPVPIRTVLVYADVTPGGKARVMLPDIPPCEVQVHRIAAPAGTSFVKPANGLAGYDRLVVQFATDSRKWALTSESLAEVADWTSAPAGKLIDRRITSTPVSDCGEGG